MHRPTLHRFVSLLVLLAAAITARPAHIVGGDFTYTWVGGNTYQFTLCVYRDALAGGAPFDGLGVGVTGSAEAYVVIYNENSSTIVDIEELDPPVIDTDIDPPFSNPCLDEPTNIEIDEGCYTFSYTFPSNASGGHDPFTLSYGRCCRNAIIDNLVAPGDQGALYYARVPARTAGQAGNNSPVFVQPPPIFICQDAPFVYDHSATDPDGDSLVYSLCPPYQSLSTTTPALTSPGGGFPTPADVPPEMTPGFTPINYSSPTFSATDPFGFGTPLTIDDAGTLRATPANNGTYVVGICVDEYRDGVLINTLSRDFQYTVTDCNIPIIDVSSQGVDPITTEEIFLTSCDDFTVNFSHSSIFNPDPASIPLNFWWSFGDGTTSNLQSPSHTYADTGRYIVQTVAFKTEGGVTCYSDTITRVVKIYPFLDVGFTAAPGCVGESTTFLDTSNAPFDVLDAWSWDFGDGSTSNAQNPTHTYSTSGNFTVELTASTEEGCEDSETLDIAVFPDPVAAFDAPSTLCRFDPVTFTNNSSIASGSIDSYLWDFGDGTTSTVFEPSHSFTAPGTFTVTLTATSDSGCIDVQTQTITVFPLPNVTITPDDTICPGTSIALNATGGTSYAWSPAAGLSDASAPNPVATPSVPTTYSVTVTDANGCSDVASVTIGLYPQPVADAGLDTSVCLNIADATVFNDVVTLDGAGGVNYQWSPGDFLDDPLTEDPTVTAPDSNVTYQLTITDANGCQDVDSVTVFVLNPDFDLIEFEFDSVCSGDTLVMNVYDQGPITSYTWTPPVFITDPTIREPGFFPPTDREYVLAIDNYCYQKTDTVVIDVLPRPVVDAGPIDSVCAGDPPYQLNATPSTLETYLWTSTDTSISDPTIPDPLVSPVVTSNYVFTGIDSFGTRGCASVDSTTIFVFPLPELIIDPVPPFICQGDSLELGITSQDAIDFQWDPDPTLIDGNTSTPVVFPPDSTRYYATVFNAAGCARRDSVDVRVTLPVTATVSDDTSICRGFSVRLFAGGGETYRWSPADEVNNPAQQNPYAFPDSSQTFTVIVQNPCFADTAQTYVEVHQLPPIDAGDDFTVIRDETGQLDGSGDGPVLWYTADGQTLDGILGDPESLNPVVSPFDTTDYVLRVQDPLTGCFAYDTVRVNVEVITLIALPTGFTPNSDGTNDLFRIIKTLNIDEILTFEVYDRWGELVFRADGPDDGWDGIYKGRPAPIGSYVWSIRARTKDLDIEERSGTITLIR